MNELKYFVCPICEKTLYFKYASLMVGEDNDFIIVGVCGSCASTDKDIGQRTEIYDKFGFFTRSFPDYGSFYAWSDLNKQSRGEENL